MSKVKPGKSDNWTKIRHDVLAALDIAAEYRALGVDVVGTEEAGADWIACRVFGEEDRTPSAGINVSRTVSRGRYHNHRTGEDISFFDFAVDKAHVAVSYSEALKFYADKAHVSIPKKKHPSDGIETISYSPLLARSWFARKPPITEAAFLRAGGSLVRHGGEIRIGLPVFGVCGDTEPPIGWVVWDRLGLPIPIGYGDNRTFVKMQTITGSEAGIMGRHGLAHLENAETIWLTEGPTDLLALDASIPDDLRGKHVVVTHSGGAGERPKEWQVNLFAGKKVVVLSDADAAGIAGAKKWAEAIATVAEETRTAALPYERTESKGKDVRDFFNENHVFQELIDLADAAPVVEKKAVADEISDDEEICEAIGLEVLGEHRDRTVIVFSKRLRKTIEFRRIRQLTFEDLLQAAGEIVKRRVLPGKESEDGKFSFIRVRQAIATLASKNRLTSSLLCGQGNHRSKSGHLVLVGKGEAAVWDGQTLERLEQPFYDGLALDFDSKATFWNFDSLKERLESLAEGDPEQKKEVRNALMRLDDLFHEWWWRMPHGGRSVTVPITLTGLVMATWLQSIWPWRPQISIVGPSHSGKSTLLEFVTSLFGENAVLNFKPTEAGLRQNIGNSSKALIIDEFEADDQRKKILEFVRSSGKGGKQLRGSQNQKGLEYGLKHIGWFGAIEIGLIEAADKNRFINLSLIRPPQGKRPPAIPKGPELERIAETVLAAAIFYANDALDLLERLKTENAIHGFDNRIIEQFAVPAAIYSCAGQMGEKYAHSMLEASLNEYDKENLPVQDHERLIGDIMTSVVKVNGYGDYTVGQCLEHFKLGMNTDPFKDALEKVGIGPPSINPASPNFEMVFINPTTVSRFLLDNTIWKGKTIRQILIYALGAVESSRKIGGAAYRGVKIPTKLFDGPEKDTEIAPEGDEKF